VTPLSRPTGLAHKKSHSHVSMSGLPGSQPPFSLLKPFDLHLRTGRTRHCNSSQFLQRAVVAAAVVHNTSNINFRSANAQQILWEVWQCPTMSCEQLQSSATSNDVPSQLGCQNSSVPGQLFPYEHPNLRSQANASALLFFFGHYVDLGLPFCLPVIFVT
jgi:hypothetical protein